MHTHCRWQLDKGSWISSNVKDENRCVWVLESDYLNMKESLEAENARLKAEVENSKRINTELLALSNRQASDIRRLTKAGDAYSDVMDRKAMFLTDESRLMARTASLAFKDALTAAKGVQS